MENIIKKADILIEALPYIKAFHKKITVIKYGGSILGDEKIRLGVLEDIVFLSYMGIRPVLVHGGGPNISEKMKNSGKKTDFVEWDFACISNDVGYTFPGFSAVQFIEKKISFIHEYRMTYKAYEWGKNELTSE